MLVALIGLVGLLAMHGVSSHSEPATVDHATMGNEPPAQAQVALSVVAVLAASPDATAWGRGCRAMAMLCALVILAYIVLTLRSASVIHIDRATARRLFGRHRPPDPPVPRFVPFTPAL
jgi:hypothetical protein